MLELILIVVVVDALLILAVPEEVFLKTHRTVRKWARDVTAKFTGK